MKKSMVLIALGLGFTLFCSFIYTHFYPKPAIIPARETEQFKNGKDIDSGIKAAGVVPAKVDFDAYEALLPEAKAHRKNRLVDLDEFIRMSKNANTIIIDARSDSMFTAKHISGAVHLNFSDFTQERLASLIPSMTTRILIYCNNNFKGDQQFFPTKEVRLTDADLKELSPAGMINSPQNKVKPVTMALNIPTYINLYGYGYRNLYELSELVDVNDPRIVLEGSAVK